MILVKYLVQKPSNEVFCWEENKVTPFKLGPQVRIPARVLKKLKILDCASEAQLKKAEFVGNEVRVTLIAKSNVVQVNALSGFKPLDAHKNTP